MLPPTRIPALCLLLALSACDKSPEPSAARATQSASSTPSTTASASAPVPPVTRIPAPPRLVAIGDLHGDLAATRAVLKLAGAIDDKDHWAGKDLMVVQTGDQLDRGDDERAILDLLDRLTTEAKAAGGSMVVLDGNHEVMNVALDFRYATPAGLKDFAGIPGARTDDPRLGSVPEANRARAAAFLPGAPVARRLAARGIVAVVGDSVFVHGGVLPKHVRYGLDRMNHEVSAWMNGEAQAAPAIVTSEDGPIWTRRYSAQAGEDDCRVLREALALVQAKRMVVGHTVQRGGISPACNEQVWRIDVGLSKVYGGKPEVLEIAGDKVKVLGR